MKKMGTIDTAITLGMVPIVVVCAFSLLWGTALWAQKSIAPKDNDQDVEIARLQAKVESNTSDIKEIRGQMLTVYIALAGVLGNFVMSIRINHKMNGRRVTHSDTVLAQTDTITDDRSTRQ